MPGEHANEHAENIAQCVIPDLKDNMLHSAKLTPSQSSEKRTEILRNQCG